MQKYSLPEQTLNSLVGNLSRKIVAEKFSAKTHLTTEDINKLSHYNQLNQFILFQIYQDLNGFLSRLQHPLVDFRSEEIRIALSELQMVLSKHVRVEKTELISMLEKALYNTIRLLMNPLESFTTFFFGTKDTVSVMLLEKYVSYFSDFDFVVTAVLAYCHNNHISLLDKKTFIEKAEKVIHLYQEKHNENLDTYRKRKFAELTGYDFDRLANGTEIVPQSQPSSLTSLVWTNTNLEKEPDISATPQQNQRVHTADLMKNLFGADVADRPNFQQQRNRNPLLSAIEYEPVNRVAESFTSNNQTGNKIAIETIPLQKQFQFVQKLFGGSNVRFKNVIDKINEFNTLAEAEAYLAEQVFNKDEININSPLCQEFLQLVRNRF